MPKTTDFQPTSTTPTWRPTRASMHGVTFADLISPEARAALAAFLLDGAREAGTE